MFTFLTVRFRTLAPSDPLNACQERAQVPELVAKLLVAAERQEMPNRVKTTRACLLELTESGERDMLARRHAECYRDLLASAADGSAAEDGRPTAYAPEIDNIRAARDLHRALAPDD